MFKTILFYHDEKGKPLIDPRKLLARHVSSKSFKLVSSVTHPWPGMSLRLERTEIDTKRDVYLDDKRPVRTLLNIACPTVTFEPEGVQVIGFFEPCLCMAGLLQAPFNDRPLVKGAPYVSADDKWREVYVPSALSNPVQRILLLAEELK